MNKTTMTFTIDADLALSFRSQIPERQRSLTINNLLKSLVTVKKTDEAEEILLDKIEELQNKRQKIIQEITEITVQLERRKTDTEKQFNEVHDIRAATDHATNVLRGLK